MAIPGVERKKQMSLILQALKKAKDLTSRKAPPPPTALASFRFGRPTRAQKVRRIALVYLLPALVLTLVIGFGVNFWANRLKKPRAAVLVQAPVPPLDPVVTLPPEAAPAQAQPADTVQQTANTPAAKGPVPARATSRGNVESAPKPQAPAPSPAQPRRVSRPAPQVTSQPPSAGPVVSSNPTLSPPVEGAGARTQPDPPAPVQPQQPGVQITASSRDPFELALFFQRSGDYLKAFEQYNRVLDKDPLNASVYNNMGLMHQASHNYLEAIKVFRQATYINPNYDKAHNNLGTALMGAGQDPEAGREFNRALELNPKNSEAMTNLAILARKSGNIDQAKTLYLRALQVNQSSPQTHYNLAMIYEEQGEFGKAIEHFKKFLNLGSGSYPEIARDVEKKVEELSKK